MIFTFHFPPNDMSNAENLSYILSDPSALDFLQKLVFKRSASTKTIFISNFPLNDLSFEENFSYSLSNPSA